MKVIFVYTILHQIILPFFVCIIYIIIYIYKYIIELMYLFVYLEL
jgi:hypothetical protein